MLSSDLFDQIDTFNSENVRRNAIINYVRRHPEEDMKQVTEALAPRFGSPHPMFNTIRELIEEGVLAVKRKRRSNTLTVNEDNLLIIIPKELHELFEQFKVFVNVIKNLHKEKPEINYRPRNPNPNLKFNFEQIRNSVPTLSYRVIDIINDLYTFYFIFILPLKIDKQNVIVKLFHSYFDNMNNMYSYVSNELGDVISPYNLTSITGSALYKAYMDSKKENNFTKVASLVQICRVLGIEDKVYGVLDLLWRRNPETSPLVYQILDFHPMYFEMTQSKLNIKYNDKVENDLILKRIHLSIDNWIFDQEGFTQEDRNFFY